MVIGAEERGGNFEKIIQIPLFSRSQRSIIADYEQNVTKNCF
jgi:hypothetical protein